MVWACPHVQGDECPEVDYRQAVAEHGAPGLLWNEVVHHSEEAGGEEKADGIVAVPPLHHGVDHTWVCTVRAERCGWHSGTVHEVQYRNGENVGGEKPVGDVDVLHAALGEGAEEHHGVGHPHDGDEDVDRPFQFSVFLAAGNAERQGDGRRQDDGLPAPEGEASEFVGKQAHVAGALDDVVAGGEERRTAEGENDGVRVERAKPGIGQPRDVEVQRRPKELGGNDDPDQHADDAPDYGHQGKLPDHAVIVVFGLLHGSSLGFYWCLQRCAGM